MTNGFYCLLFLYSSHGLLEPADPHSRVFDLSKLMSWGCIVGMISNLFPNDIAAEIGTNARACQCLVANGFLSLRHFAAARSWAHFAAAR